MKHFGLIVTIFIYTVSDSTYLRFCRTFVYITFIWLESFFLEYSLICVCMSYINKLTLLRYLTFHVTERRSLEYVYCYIESANVRYSMPRDTHSCRDSRKCF